tara:strand:- start:286 stop:900 length:615 start_codon:yes stop_codon:yes gene_type:complete
MSPVWSDWNYEEIPERVYINCQVDEWVNPIYVFSRNIRIYAIYAIYAIIIKMFPNEVWRQIVDYTPIHRNIHRKKLKAVLSDHMACYEAMFDHLFPLMTDMAPEWKLDYLDDDCVALTRETLPNTMFVSSRHPADHLNDPMFDEESMFDPEVWVYDPEESKCYLPVGPGVMQLPYYRHAKPMELWSKNPGSLYRVRWTLDYMTV